MKRALCIHEEQDLDWNKKSPKNHGKSALYAQTRVPQPEKCIISHALSHIYTLCHTHTHYALSHTEMYNISHTHSTRAATPTAPHPRNRQSQRMCMLCVDILGVFVGSVYECIYVGRMCGCIFVGSMCVCVYVCVSTNTPVHTQCTLSERDVLCH